MGRGIVTFALALVTAAAAFAPRAVAAPVRLAIQEGGAPVEFSGSSVTRWQDGPKRWLVFDGNFMVASGQLKMKADRAVVWTELSEDGKLNRGVIYAEGHLRGVQQLQPLDTTLVSFATPAEIRVLKDRIVERSLADSELVRRAVDAQAPRRLPAAAPTSTGVIQQVQGAIRETPAPPIAGPVVPQAPGNAAPPSGDNSPPPAARPGNEPPVFESPVIPLPQVNTRKLKIGNRSANPTNAKYLNMPDGEQVALITGGVKLLAFTEQKGGLILDVEADQMVIWQRGGKSNELVEAMSDREGVTQGNDKQTEIYMSGNVVIRYGAVGGPRNPDGSPVEEKTLRADRVYYDVTNNRAIAEQADLEMARTGLVVPAHFRGERIVQLSAQEYKAIRTSTAASALPASPGLDLRMRDVTITEQKNQVERTIFGFPVIDRFTGEEVIGSDRHFRSTNTTIDLAGIPVMYFPVLAGDVDDPTGPLSNLFFRQDRIFGTQFLTTWSVLELIGVKKLPGERFNLMLDYLSERGFAAGLAYDLAAPKLFGYDAPFNTHFLAYGLNDRGFDVLGGTRSQNWDPPGYRGRVLWRHVQDYDDFSYQGQISYLSDTNFLEQYYNYEFNQGPNQETFSYLKWQQGNLAATALGEVNIRPWITETSWLPRADAFLIGESFFDRFTYNTWASAGYANLHVYNLPFNQYPSTVNPFTVPTPDYPIVTTRLDWMHQLSMPFMAGPFKIVPYVNGDVAYYSNDVNGDSRGRLYGGFGTRGSMPLTRQFDGVESELFNLHGLNHKVVFAANYYNAWSDTPYNLLPQLDRLNDDATQESIRDITPWQTTYVPGPDGQALFNSPLYNPRAYAIRRLLDTKPDELDTIQVLQGEVRQRWQTKRGYPGMEHTVDYVTLDLSGSWFPAPNRDNFGHPVSFLEYNATWAVGDRNGFTSSGWVDPFAFGTRYWNVNGYYNRPDGTNFSVSYHHFDPVGSKQLSGAVNYTFSPKYFISLGASYDFGIADNQSTSLTLVRVGTDLTWSLGFAYNAIVNNFSFNFMVTPNLAGPNRGGGNFLNQGSSMKGRN